MTKFAAEVEEAARDLAVAREVEGVGDERAVARPEIGVGVAVEPQDVGVVPRDDRAVIVDLRSDDQRRALVETGDLRREMVRDRLVLVRP